MARKRKHSQDGVSQASASKRAKIDRVDPALRYPLLALYYPRVSTLRNFILTSTPKPSRSRKERLNAIPKWSPDDCARRDEVSSDFDIVTGLSELHDLCNRNLSLLLDTTIVGHGLDAPSSIIAGQHRRDVEVLSQKLQSSIQSSSGSDNVTQSEVCLLPFFLRI